MKIYRKKAALFLVVSALAIMMIFTACGGGSNSSSVVSGSQSGSLAAGESAFADIADTYYYNLSIDGGMNVDMYLQISDDGSFVFSRSTDFSDKEKGAGYVEKDEDDNYSLVYEIVRDEEVEVGEYVSQFEITAENEIQFLSDIWFGSTTPKLTDDDGNPIYLKFGAYDESETSDVSSESQSIESSTASESQTSSSSSQQQTGNTNTNNNTNNNTTNNNTNTNTNNNTTQQSSSSQSQQPSSSSQAQQPATASVDGTYTGTHVKYVDAMDANITYNMTLTMAGGTYIYNTSFTLESSNEAMNGYSDNVSYSGTYIANGNNITMTGEMKSAVLSGNSLSLTGFFSSFAGSQDTATLSK